MHQREWQTLQEVIVRLILCSTELLVFPQEDSNFFVVSIAKFRHRHSTFTVRRRYCFRNFLPQFFDWNIGRHSWRVTSACGIAVARNTATCLSYLRRHVSWRIGRITSRWVRDSTCYWSSCSGWPRRSRWPCFVDRCWLTLIQINSWSGHAPMSVRFAFPRVSSWISFDFREESRVYWFSYLTFWWNSNIPNRLLVGSGTRMYPPSFARFCVLCNRLPVWWSINDIRQCDTLGQAVMKPPLLYWVSRSNLILPCVVGSGCRFNDSFLVSLGQVSM